MLELRNKSSKSSLTRSHDQAHATTAQPSKTSYRPTNNARATRLPDVDGSMDSVPVTCWPQNYDANIQHTQTDRQTTT